MFLITTVCMVQNVPKMAGFHCKQHVEIHHLQLQFPTQDISRRGFPAMFAVGNLPCFHGASAFPRWKGLVVFHSLSPAMIHQKIAGELESEDCLFADHYHIYKISTVLWGVHKSQGTLNLYLSQLIFFMKDIQETLVWSKQLKPADDAAVLQFVFRLICRWCTWRRQWHMISYDQPWGLCSQLSPSI